MAIVPPQLVLASNSPWRRELLRQAGYRFQVRPPPIDDSDADLAGMTPEHLVEHLAWLKAASVADDRRLTGALVLVADTVVVLGGRIIGKPADQADARRILSELSGSTHRVLTGLALIDTATGRRLADHDVTLIRMRIMTPAEIDSYVTSGEAMGKAGAYALQETGDRYVESLEGSATNVVGLPMQLLERMLRAAGYDPREFHE